MNNMSQDSLALLKGIYGADGRGFDGTASNRVFKNWGNPVGLAKAITTAYGLVAIDLQAPSKNLYPVLTPLRNKIPRVPGNGGLSTQWRQISAINNSALTTQAWIPEGQRAAAMQYTTANKAASYVTIGQDDFITFEAVKAAAGYEDLRSSMTMRLLQKAMINEEYGILFGNATLALGTPAAGPTLAAAGTGGTLPTATYSVIAVPLTGEGVSNAKLATGVPQAVTITGMDGLTYTLNGGSGNKSASSTLGITLGQILSATITNIQGALGWAWYVGTVGNETLQAITTTNSASFSTALAAGRQSASAITADCSTNPNLAFDGLLTAALNPANLAYVKDMGGATLTASSKGSINEIDVAMKAMWDTFRLSITAMYVNSQEQQNITTKVLNATSGPLLRYNTDGKEPMAIVANGVVTFYYNPFSMDGGTTVPVKIHPYLPPGCLLGWCENLPAYYMNNNVPQVAEMHCRADYYEQEYPIRTRRYEHGVYAEETLAIYATFAMMVIYNIGNG